jgi:hypothetical protein
MKLALAIAATLAPAASLACPACAQGGGRGAAYFIAAMIVAPYAVAAAVIRAIRSADREAP